MDFRCHLTFRLAPQAAARLAMMKAFELLSPSSFLLTLTHHTNISHFTVPLSPNNLHPNSPTTKPPTMSSQRLTHLPRLLSRRAFSTTPRHTTSFKTGPAPPRLPKDEQKVFEKLQKQSTGAFSIPQSSAAPSSSSSSDLRSRINQSPDSTPNIQFKINQSPDSDSSSSSGTGSAESGGKAGEGEQFHPNMRRGAPPEFEGDVNPKTGEVGGPKNDPLRWGGKADWSYNGRVTDF
jgi:hypothetical protein